MRRSLLILQRSFVDNAIIWHLPADLCLYGHRPFISSLTSYSVVAALGTLGVLSLLNYMGDLCRKWQSFGISPIGYV